MPALTNKRQELFAQFVARGVPRYRAYPLAGYKFDEGAPYRLAGNVRVKARLAELLRPVTRKTQASATSLLAELDESRRLAFEVGNAAAAISATVAKAKLLGLWVKRAEKGSAGAFDKAETLRAIAERHGPDVADLLARALGFEHHGVPASEAAKPSD